MNVLNLNHATNSKILISLWPQLVYKPLQSLIKIEGEGMTQASLVAALFVQQNLANPNIRYLQA